MNQNSKRNSEKDLIFGTRAIMEAIEAGKELDNVLIQKDLSNDLIKELLSLCNAHSVPVQKVPKEKLNRVSRKNHQGCIAFISAVSYASLDNIVNTAFQEGRDPFIMLLDRITDVRNFGAIARSAHCAGVDALVIPLKGSAQINSDAVKTSAGALHHLPVCRDKSLFSALQYLQNSGITVVCCTEKASEEVYNTNLNMPIALVMGSEEDGISNELLKAADKLVKIPMKGKVSSLNVSVAAAIMSFEVLRQRSL